MVNFNFKNPTEIFFGKGSVDQLGPALKKYGASNVLFHYGGGSIKTHGIYDQVVKALNGAGISFTELGGVVPNPRLSLIKEGIALCREKKIDFILAVGGGSVIDSAKGIGVGAVYSGDVWDFYTDKASPEATLPVATILTIPAAGSEASFSSVVTNDDGAYKRPLDVPVLYPAFSILDPEYTYTLPPYQTACGICDMFVHVCERYFTQDMENDLTDRLCEATMRAIINNALTVMAKPRDYAARAEIMWCGTIAHNNILSTGRTGDWASHLIEHELSAINDVAHGAGLSIIVPNWMKYVYKHNTQRFVQFAERVFDIKDSSPETAINKGIDALRAFFSSIGLPATLTEIGIGEDSFKGIGEKTKKFDTQKGTVGNFYPLTGSDIEAILKLAK
ncbi:MAG: iron-containing alcohol dehydrogenase [Treponema sp.]|nr:iron-containing alcohol dehydrogenase [Treponema sp.]